MALTRNFKITVAARVQSDPMFAQALLDEAITLFINGEPETAKLILRDLVNASIGFEKLALEIHKPASHVVGLRQSNHEQYFGDICCHKEKITCRGAHRSGGSVKD